MQTSPEINETDLAYFAGIIDGEGTITITKRRPEMFKTRRLKSPRYDLSMCLSNTDRRFMESASGFFRHRYRQKSPSGFNKTPGRRPIFEIVLSAKQAYWWSKKLLPFLRIKRKQAELAIRFHEDMKRGKGYTPLSSEEVNKREHFFLQMRLLNKRGSNGDRKRD